MRPSHSVFLHSNGDTLEVYKSATGALIVSCNRPMAPMAIDSGTDICVVFLIIEKPLIL